jgi:hypothetical protein
VPRWEREHSKGRHGERMPMANSGQVSVFSKRLFIAPTATSAQVNLPAKTHFSNDAGQVAVKGMGLLT